jgi:hypothetical protein
VNSDYGIITVPAGTLTTNKTGMGIDLDYNFVLDTAWIKPIDGVPQYGLLHDVTYYGINIPEEYFHLN